MPGLGARRRYRAGRGSVCCPPLARVAPCALVCCCFGCRHCLWGGLCPCPANPIKLSTMRLLHLVSSPTELSRSLRCSSSPLPLVVPSCSCVRRTSWAGRQLQPRPVLQRTPPSPSRCHVLRAERAALGGGAGLASRGANATDGSGEGWLCLCQGENGSAAKEYFQKPLLPWFVITSRFSCG